MSSSHSHHSGHERFRFATGDGILLHALVHFVNATFVDSAERRPGEA
jgi:hypothetical protein